MTSEFIRKFHIYKLILQFRNSYISKQQIIEKLEDLYEANFENPLYVGLTKTSEKTISRDVNDIQTFFGVEINHRRNYGYQLVEEIVENEAYQKIIDKTELFLASHKEEEWSNYVTTENSSLNPAINIFHIIRAIKEHYYVKISYDGWFDDDRFGVIKNTKVQPLHIKEANRAWYLIVYNEEFGVKTICLDHRVTNLEFTTEKITHPFEFNPKEYFKNSFNILNDHSKPIRIVLKVANHHFKYLVSKPLHHSQKVLSSPVKMDTLKLDYLDPEMWGKIEVFLQPNHEFIMEIFKYNLWVQVMEPESFAYKIARHYQFVAQHYYPLQELVTEIEPS